MAREDALVVGGCAGCGKVPWLGWEDSALTEERWPGSGEKSMGEEHCGRKGGSRGSQRGERVGREV